MGKLGADLVGTAGDQLALHQRKSAAATKHPIICMAGFGTGLGGIGHKYPIFLGILKKIPLKTSVFLLQRPFHNGQIPLIHLPVLDLLIHNTQSLCRFGGNDDAAGIAVNAVAQCRGEGMFLPGTPFLFLIQVCLDMVKQRSALLRTVVGMHRQTGAVNHQKNMIILIYNI